MSLAQVVKRETARTAQRRTGTIAATLLLPTQASSRVAVAVTGVDE